MTTIIIAVGCAVLASCCFAGAVVLQHGAVRATVAGESLGVRGLSRVVRSGRWLAGAGLAAAGGGLHVTALSLAPLVIVQPIGVVSLVLTVLVGSSAGTVAVTPRLRVAVISVCAGVGGFVVLAAIAGAPVGGDVRPGPPIAVACALAMAAGLLARGRSRCLVQAASAALLFGTGAALVRAASVNVTASHAVTAGLEFAAESGVLMVAGGWLLHQAYAAGPPAAVVAATTVIDPLTAVAIGIGVYGEAARTSVAHAVLQAGFALLAVAGVIVLARSAPDPRPTPRSKSCPTPAHVQAGRGGS